MPNPGQQLQNCKTSNVSKKQAFLTLSHETFELLQGTLVKANIPRVLQLRGMVRTTKGMGIAGSGSGNFVQLFVTPWTVAHQAPLSMGFSRQEYWSGLPFPSPGDLPNPGIKSGSPALQADSLPSEPPWKPLFLVRIMFMAMRRWEGQKLGSWGVLAGPSLWVAVIGGWKCLELLRM